MTPDQKVKKFRKKAHLFLGLPALITMALLLLWKAGAISVSHLEPHSSLIIAILTFAPIALVCTYLYCTALSSLLLKRLKAFDRLTVETAA